MVNSADVEQYRVWKTLRNSVPLYRNEKYELQALKKHAGFRHQCCTV